MRPTSIKSVSYEPAQVPADISETDVLRRYLREEFERIAACIRLMAAGHMDPIFAAPIKPRRGDMIYADGVLFDPGGGEGFYYYNGSGIWTQLG